LPLKKIKQISSPFLLYAADWAEAEWEKKRRERKVRKKHKNQVKNKKSERITL
jgi:hypothetical protein